MGLNGLPPVKDQYDENEKKQIVEAAEEHDLKSVAKAYGLTWQKVRRRHLIRKKHLKLSFSLHQVRKSRQATSWRKSEMLTLFTSELMKMRRIG